MLFLIASLLACTALVALFAGAFLVLAVCALTGLTIARHVVAAIRRI